MHDRRRGNRIADRVSRVFGQGDCKVDLVVGGVSGLTWARWWVGVCRERDSGPCWDDAGSYTVRRLEGAAVLASLSLLAAVLDQPSGVEERARRDAAGLMRALESVTDRRERRGRRFELGEPRRFRTADFASDYAASC